MDDFSGDFHSGASSKKFLTFYSHGDGKISFLLDSMNFDVHMLAVGKFYFKFGDFNIEKKITWTGVSRQSMHLVKRQKYPL